MFKALKLLKRMSNLIGMFTYDSKQSRRSFTRNSRLKAFNDSRIYEKHLQELFIRLSTISDPLIDSELHFSSDNIHERLLLHLAVWARSVNYKSCLEYCLMEFFVYLGCAIALCNLNKRKPLATMDHYSTESFITFSIEKFNFQSSHVWERSS